MTERENTDGLPDAEEGWRPTLSKRPREDTSADEDTSDDSDDSDDCNDIAIDERQPTDAKRLRIDRDLRCEDYTVGWVCALPKEMAAARAVLDHVHETLPTAPNDHNSYTFGSIGDHNIVIACLPAGQYGITSAAIVANNMQRSFPSLQTRLMVGIGGGVPSKDDIRLGDVVVSNQVIPYQFGKTVQAGRFKHTGFSNRPPSELLTVVASLEADSASLLTRISATLDRVGDQNPFARRPTEPDRLFDAEYDHPEQESSCAGCDSSMLITRPTRPDNHPRIHRGSIASGDQVMKHGKTRDRLARCHDVLCFEMEAAGLMDSFPCLVIRGVCDYSDSHKAKQWQEYAAVTAAAYARELLCAICTQKTQKPSTQTKPLVRVNLSPADKAARRQSLWKSLKFDQIDNRQSNIKAALGKTCRWLISHSSYKHWLDPAKLAEHHGFLWISGKPGAGKSTIMKFALGRTKKRRVKNSASNAAVIHFFFNARGEENEKTTAGMYRSLLHQLLQSIPDLNEVLDTVNYSQLTEDGSFPWELQLLQKLFKKAVKRLGQRQVSCFIDALDECEEEEVRKMVNFFEELCRFAVKRGTKLYTCFSSRHYPYISIRNGLKLTLEHQNGHKEDLAEYVRNQLETETEKQTEELTTQILLKASGVFMWVVLVIDILNKEIQRGRMFAVKERLNALPAGLSELFEDILKRDSENMEDLLLSIQWVLFSKRPLNREEYYFALLSGLKPNNSLQEWDAGETSIESMERFVVSSSKGLAETTKAEKRTVQFIHESVRDFLLKDNGLQRLWPDLGDEFEGRSHDRLKECCHVYIAKIDITSGTHFWAPPHLGTPN